MSKYLKRAGYVGPCDVTTIIDKSGKTYFLEWSIRFGYDAIYNLLTLLKGNISDFLLNDFNANFHDGYSCSQRISIPPFPYSVNSLLKDMAKDVSVGGVSNDFYMEDVYFDGGFKSAGVDGIIGIMTNRGQTLEKAWSGVYRKVGMLKIGSYLQYRVDGYKQSRERLNKLLKQGAI